MAGTVGTLVTTILEHHVQDFVFVTSTQCLMELLSGTDGDAYEPSDDRLSNSSGQKKTTGPWIFAEVELGGERIFRTKEKSIMTHAQRLLARLTGTYMERLSSLGSLFEIYITYIIAKTNDRCLRGFLLPRR